MLFLLPRDTINLGQPSKYCTFKLQSKQSRQQANNLGYNVFRFLSQILSGFSISSKAVSLDDSYGGEVVGPNMIYL